MILFLVSVSSGTDDSFSLVARCTGANPPGALCPRPIDGKIRPYQRGFFTP